MSEPAYEARGLDLEIQIFLEEDEVDRNRVADGEVYLAGEALDLDLVAREPDLVFPGQVEDAVDQTLVGQKVRPGARHLRVHVALQALVGVIDGSDPDPDEHGEGDQREGEDAAECTLSRLPAPGPAAIELMSLCHRRLARENRFSIAAIVPGQPLVNKRRYASLYPGSAPPRRVNRL